MRVIAGIAKGIILKSPKGLRTRPTSAKVKEAIFSSIGDKIVQAYVLDLFAGSGALGIEALSRGTQFAIFVDSSFRAINSIKKNLKITNFVGNSKIIKTTVQSFLSKYDNRPFDLIFIDTPYRIGLSKLGGIINLALNVLNKEGILIVEHSSKVSLGPDKRIIKTKKYGQTLISFIRKAS